MQQSVNSTPVQKVVRFAALLHKARAMYRMYIDDIHGNTLVSLDGSLLQHYKHLQTAGYTEAPTYEKIRRLLKSSRGAYAFYVVQPSGPAALVRIVQMSLLIK